jgi:hypothetical protein
MRALVVHPGPAFSVADVSRGWARGLHEIGIETRTFALDTLLDYFAYAYQERDGEIVKAHTDEEVVQLAAGQIKSACYDWWPDLVVVISGFYMAQQLVEIMRNRHRHIVLVCTESPYEDAAQLQKAAWYDAVIVNDPLNLDAFTEACEGPAVYMPHCYDPAVHHPGFSRHQSDCAFIGTGYPSRQRFLERVDFSGIDLVLGGNWQNAPESLTRYVGHPLDQCVDNTETAGIYRGTRTSFNLYRLETNGDMDDSADGIACGPREIELAATGTWFARQSRPESDELFPMLPVFSSPEELGDVLRWALANPDVRDEAGSAARSAILDRTFPNNAKRLMGLLGH